MTDSFRFAYLHEPPFCFTQADGSVAGHDVELIAHVAALAGFRLDMVETEFCELLPGLTDGRWEITTGLFATTERRSIAHFTRPIWSLPDGLMVQRGNPLSLAGYRSIATNGQARLAVIRDQVQHQAALENGVLPEQISIFSTQAEAASAVIDGVADAYASVAMAHRGYAVHNSGASIEVIDVSPTERPPEAGAFAIAKGADGLLERIDTALAATIGTPWQKALEQKYGLIRMQK